MDRDRLIGRARNIVLTPKTEWPAVVAEADSVAGLYRNYILWLAALPAIAGFLKTSVFGIGVPMLGTIRVGFGAGLASMVLQYGVHLGVVYLLAMLVNALAPTFGGQKDMTQALKATAYASTASWLGGTLVVVPWIGSLLALAGGIYAIYLLYLGLPLTMQAPQERALPYTAVTVVAALVLSLVFSAIVGSVTGMSRMMAGGHHDSVEIKAGGKTVSIDSDKIEAWSKKVEEAGKRMEAAHEAGDQEAQQEALGQMMGALLGGDEAIEPLSPEQLKPFVPEALGELSRRSYSVKRSTIVGVQVAEAEARYADDDAQQSIALEITDTGGARAFAALAGWVVQEVDSQTERGYERVYHDGDRSIREVWDEPTQTGTYSVMVGERFAVKLEGSGVDMDVLRKAAKALDLKGLEALKDAPGKTG